MTNAVESDAVLAFIRDNQGRVLREASAELSAAAPEDLPRVVHALYGSLGSYQLTEAHRHVAELAAVLNDPATTSDDHEAARAQAVAALHELEESLA